jgi:amino acid adenylation domain-containing protein
MIAEENQIHELTPTQQAMLIYSLYAPESKAYFEQVCYSYRGPLNTAAFAAAWQRVIERHQILRTSFSTDDPERLSQIVHSEATLSLQQHDWRQGPLSRTGIPACPGQTGKSVLRSGQTGKSVLRSEQERLRDEFLKADCDRGFDLTTAPLIRVALLQTGDEAFWIVVSNHHIILDGWSMSLVRDEVSQFYQQLAHGRETNLQDAPDFAGYLQWLEQQDTTQAETFWRTELAGVVGPNILPIDSGAVQSSVVVDSFAEKTISLSAELTTAIRDCAKRSHLTISTVLQGAWAILLSRYSASDDLVFGITVSGRPYDLPQVESLVGLLINTLPVRVKLSDDESTLACLKQIQRRVSSALEYEHCSLKQIQNWSEVPFNLPLFETLLVFENFAGSGSSFDLGGPVEVSSAQLSRTNYPLTLVVNPGTELRLQLVYHRNRFADDVIERMLAHLANILTGIAADIEQSPRSLPMLTAAETRELLVNFNNTAREFPAAAVTRMFERQAELTPKAIAVVSEAEEITYEDLNTRANRLAHYLKQLGVGAESLVGISLPRSPAVITAVLAILKAGGAYVPLDPGYPKDRLAFMLSDSGADVLLTQSTLANQFPDYTGKLICLDAATEEISAQVSANLDEAAKPADAAYVIYTSGSTGKPKGTLIEHRSLLNFTHAASLAYEISDTDRVLQFASLSFDTSAEEIFPALTRGATLVLRTDLMISSSEHFLHACSKFGITVLDLPTAYWHELTVDLVADNLSLPESIRLVILGGEKALPGRLAAWREHVRGSVRLLNSYGPTETTIVATICDLSVADASAVSEAPIGRPIANVIVYVLDAKLRPVPLGLPGELYIGGAGVARGYLNQPGLTNQKFITNPFADERAPRIYRTGDVVCYRPDGNLEFLGRIDNQVKIRGFRIELEEIEQAIREHANVAEAVVLGTDDGGDKKLVAYVVGARGAQPAAAGELRQFLSGKLPGYMMPATFTFIDAIPLMPNGKTDRRALLNLGQFPDASSSENFAGPRSPLEESIADVWATVLKIEHPDIHENFFELGGHSLLAAKLISNLRRQLHVELNLIDVFQSPTIARLAALIYERQTESEADDELASLLAEIVNLSDEEAHQRLTQEIGKGGLRAQALKLALIASGAVQLLADVL